VKRELVPEFGKHIYGGVAMQNCFLRLKYLMIMGIIGLTLCFALELLYRMFPRIHTFEDANSTWLSFTMKAALLAYQIENGHFPHASFFSEESSSGEPGLMQRNNEYDFRVDIRHPIGCNAREFSWRVQLLPFFYLSHEIDEILAQVFHHDYINRNELQYNLLEPPDCFRFRGRDHVASLLLMIPPFIHDQMPVILGVKRAQFNWYENGDIELWKMLNAMPDNAKLYEVRNDKIVLCDREDTSVPILAADGKVYFIPVTTNIGMLKKIADAKKIQTLHQKQRGRITVFSE